MASRQSVLDKWFLRQDIINQLLESGEESEEALKFAERIMPVVEAEESEYQSLEDPFDRSVALVLSLVKDQELNPWDVDLSTFLKVFTKRVRLESDKLNLPACGRLIRMSWEVLNQQAIVLFDRVQNMDQEEDWEDEIDFGWESDYDDQDFLFTTSILEGQADEILPSLFDERIRREEGRPVTRILVLRGAQSDALDGLLVEASKRKLKVIEGSMNDLRRMANMPFNSDPPEALGLLDRDPSASIDEIMASGGLIWLLAGAQYPVNIGFAIRTIEVSGGSAVFVDADLNSDGRKASSRASMKADRFIPVKWMSWREASDLARAHNYRIIGIEDSGDVEPWDADLKGRCMLVIGGERHGISADLLQECDSIVKIPMRGFVPSYNLQAPLAVVAAEALRQRRNNV